MSSLCTFLQVSQEKHVSYLHLRARLTCQVFVVTLFPAFTFPSSPTGRGRWLPSHSQVLQMFFSCYRNFSLPIVTKDLPRIWKNKKHISLLLNNTCCRRFSVQLFNNLEYPGCPFLKITLRPFLMSVQWTVDGSAGPDDLSDPVPVSYIHILLICLDYLNKLVLFPYFFFLRTRCTLCQHMLSFQLITLYKSFSCR